MSCAYLGCHTVRQVIMVIYLSVCLFDRLYRYLKVNLILW